MYVGPNTPYDWFEIPDDEQAEIIKSMAPEIMVVMSNTPEVVWTWLVGNLPTVKIWIVRAKTGPQNKGLYPIDILDYAEWGPGSEITLRDSCDLLISWGIHPYVVLGNEPDIEMARSPENESLWGADAQIYCDWYLYNYGAIKSVYGQQVSIAPAALSQGWHARFEEWAKHLDMVIMPVFRRCDFLTDHLYIGVPASEWQLRFKRWSRYGSVMPFFITEFNDNGTGRLVTLYKDVANWFEAHDYMIDGLVFFTISGGANTVANRPAWWFLSLDESILVGNRHLAYNPNFKLADPYAEEIVFEEVGELDMNIIDGFIQLWQVNGEFTYWANDDYTGFFKAWSRSTDTYGSPVGEEFTDEDTGDQVMAFTRGVYKWENGTLVKVNSGL